MQREIVAEKIWGSRLRSPQGWVPVAAAFSRNGSARLIAHSDERPVKEWSLADCISLVVMADEGLTVALTRDHYFEQAGFTAVFAD